MREAVRRVRLKSGLVRRDFTSPVPTYKPVGDITYLRTGNCHDNAVVESFFERTTPEGEAAAMAA